MGFFGYTSAATYYVDADITDTNVASATSDCTDYNQSTYTCGTGSASVYKTVADINLKSFSGDDLILFRKGQSWTDTITIDQSGTNGHPITIDEFGSGSHPIFTKISGSISPLVVNGNYITVKNITFIPAGTFWGNLITVSGTNFTADTVSVDGTSATTNYGNGVTVSAGSSYANVSSSTFSAKNGSTQVGWDSVFSEADHTTITNNVITGSRNYGINIRSALNGARYAFISGNTITDTNSMGMYIANGDATISNNNISNINNYGVFITGDPDYGGTTNNNSIISGNTITNCDGGVDLENDVHSVSITNNIIDAQSKSTSNGGISMIRNVTNITITGNTVKNILGAISGYGGISAQKYNGAKSITGLVIENNLIQNTSPANIYLEDGDSSLVQRNKLSGSSDSSATGSFAVQSDNNTINYNLIDCADVANLTGINLGGTENILKNLTVVRCPVGSYNFTDITTLTNSIGISAGYDISVASGKTVTGNYNLFGDASITGLGVYSDTGAITEWLSNPLFVSTSDFALQSTSTAIDSGTTISGLTTDYAGNSIYGLPDIGAYEYQPPYTFASYDIPVTGSVRLYSDGKYRMTTASSTSSTGNFSVTPLGGSYYTASTSQYMDITINTWGTTGDKNKQWTATSTAGSGLTQATSTVYTIGDLTANSYYQFKLDSSASTTAITGATCSNGTCLTDSSGNLTFTYVGGYSTHIFGLEKDVTAPSSFILKSPSNNSSGIKTDMNWTASSDPESNFAKYQLYIDGSLDTDNISSSVTSVVPQGDLTCGNHTWYVRAVDNAGNTTDSNTFNYAIACGGSSGKVRPLTSLSSSSSSSPISFPDNQNNSSLTTLLKPNQTSSEPFIFSRKLSYGSRGNDVSELQKRLTSEGVYSGPITGYYGPMTIEGVKKYQVKNNLSPVGVVGPMTLSLLNGSSSNTTSTSSSQGISLTDLVELLINLGVITPDKAEVARMAIATINKK